MPSERGQILGIGGIFFKSANQQQMREWYGKHLGLADKGGGVMMPWREKDNPEKEHVTAWTVFPESTKYFEPSPAAFMVNYIVDDLDALLERLQKEGVQVSKPSLRHTPDLRKFPASKQRELDPPFLRVRNSRFLYTIFPWTPTIPLSAKSIADLRHESFISK